MGLEGNEIVNDLAIAGMCQNPLWGWCTEDRPRPQPWEQ